MRLPTVLADSLRWRLLRGVSLSMLLIWLLAGAFTYLQARREVLQLVDGQMANTARLLLAHALRGGKEMTATAMTEEFGGTKISRNRLPLEYRVWTHEGVELLRSAQAPPFEAAASAGYSTITAGDGRWRSLVLDTSDGRLRIQVAHPLAARDREALEIAGKAIQPLAMLLPFLIALIYVSVRRGLKPLDDLAAEVAARAPDRLSALSPDRSPAETRPLIAALNQLLERIGTALEHERRFTADASHELRTPLAAIRIQAEVALAAEGSDAGRHALEQVIAGADRAGRLVGQLLRLARLDPLQALPATQTVDLAALADEVAADVSAAQSETIAPSIAFPLRPLPVTGDSDLLALALRNLVDNALRYAAGSNVLVSGGIDADGVFITVSDDGPGVDESELPRLTERFFRGRGNDREGCGLGLAIVARIAELHGARLILRNADDGGFVATLHWQVPARSARQPANS